MINDNEIIRTKTVIWIAEVIANTIEGIPQTWITKGNRLTIDKYNIIKESDNIFTIGDLAYMETPKYISLRLILKDKR